MVNPRLKKVDPGSGPMKCAVEETRRGLQSKIDNVREMNRQLEAFINELREKLRKGEKL